MTSSRNAPNVLVKICGLTRLEDAEFCAELGADWVGLNFHRPSPRYIEPATAARIVASLPERVAAVGVFVDRPAEEVAELADRIGLGIVQLHGREPPEDLRRLERLQVVRAFRVRDSSAWLEVAAYLAAVEALGHRLAGVLIDAHVAGQPGGTGASIADEALDRMPVLPRLILAGGLTPRNVADRIARARPWMVDVASGVESAPGRKDPLAVAAFIRAARGASGPGPR